MPSYNCLIGGNNRQAMEMKAMLLRAGGPRRRWPCALLFLSMTLLCLLMLGTPRPTAASEQQWSKQQIWFWEARHALRKGQYLRFNHYASKLRDYPLYPYLVYWRLKQQLPRALPLSIEAFLQRYADTPLAPLLREGWLLQLARQDRWQEYLQFYKQSDSAALRCYYHYAQYKTDDVTSAWLGALNMWQVGTFQDEACDPLFVAWQKGGGLTHELRWKRIGLLLDNGNATLARHIAAPLDHADRALIHLWSRAYHRPALLQSKRLQQDNATNRRIIFHTLRYRAYRAPRRTDALWRAMQSRYSFSTAQQTAITRALAVGYTYANNPRALQLFYQLPTEERDTEVCNHALRIALRTRHWGDALAWLAVTPDGQNRSSRAQYWRARIYEEMGFPETARYFYKTISREPGYYGFLAADRLQMPYNLGHDKLHVDSRVYARVVDRADTQRAIELYKLGLKGSARREWQLALTTMGNDERLAASKLAHDWGWEDRALLTLADADHPRDLSIRFPLSYNQAVQREAKRRAIDPAWIYAVVRQESAMMPHVESHVGALGLMQIMPQTGRQIARELRLTQPSRRQLLHPKTNIRFGSYYLRKVLHEFDDNPALATAAYNAGPHRIRKWSPKNGVMDADIWVETIPYDETRDYVRLVMAYSVYYDRRLNRPIKRLRERMPPVS